MIKLAIELFFMLYEVQYDDLESWKVKIRNFIIVLATCILLYANVAIRGNFIDDFGLGFSVISLPILFILFLFLNRNRTAVLDIQPEQIKITPLKGVEKTIAKDNFDQLFTFFQKKRLKIVTSGKVRYYGLGMVTKEYKNYQVICSIEKLEEIYNDLIKCGYQVRNTLNFALVEKIIKDADEMVINMYKIFLIIGAVTLSLGVLATIVIKLVL